MKKNIEKIKIMVLEEIQNMFVLKFIYLTKTSSSRLFFNI